MKRGSAAAAVAVTVSAALSLAGAGCGGDDEPVSGGARRAVPPLAAAARAAWQPAPGHGGAVDRSEEVVASVEALPPEAWTTGDSVAAAARWPDGEGSEVPVLLVGGEDEGGEDVLRRPLDVDPQEVDQLRLVAVSLGHQRVRVSLACSDGRVVSLPVLRMTADERPRTTSLDLPPESDGDVRYDALELRVRGDRRALGLVRVELVRRAPALHLPSAAEGSALVRLGHDARRGVGLSTERPLRTSVHVRPGARLALAAGTPAALARPGVGHRLDVRLRSHGEALASAIEWTGGRSWHRTSLDVDPLAPAGGASFDVEVEVSLATDDGRPSACAVTEPLVVAEAGERPSVLLVTSDTHRADHLGLHDAAGELETPALDALAARGVLFTGALSPANVTGPAHAGILTGVHPRDLGVLSNGDRLGGSAVTLAESFGEAGYATWAVLGAFHLADRHSGLGQGFERMSAPVWGERTVEESLAVLEGWLPDLGGRPLFLWFHAYDAHWPYEPPGEFDRRYYDPPAQPWRPIDPERHEGAEIASVEDFALPVAQYKGEVGYLDAGLARLFALEPLRDALVAFVGDHGESLGQRGIWFSHGGLYPDVLRVPLVLAGPGLGETSAERVEALVSSLDVADTLRALAGLAPRGAARLLAPEARGGERAVFALHTDGTAASITRGRHHLVLHLRRNAWGVVRHPRHRVELFDLEADPACTTDLAEGERERARALRAELIEWLTSVPVPAGDEALDAVTRGMLEQLGYASEDAEDEPLWVADDCARCAPFR